MDVCDGCHAEVEFGFSDDAGYWCESCEREQRRASLAECGGERRADVERIAEAIYVQNCTALEGEPGGTASHQEHVERGIWMAFWRAELFVTERDRRREK